MASHMVSQSLEFFAMRIGSRSCRGLWPIGGCQLSSPGRAETPAPAPRGFDSDCATCRQSLLSMCPKNFQQRPAGRHRPRGSRLARFVLWLERSALRLGSARKRIFVAFVAKGNSARAWPCEIWPQAERVLHHRGKLQQADQICDRRAVDVQPAGEIFLRALVSLQILRERRRLFQRVQILALQVFHDRQFGHLAVVGIANQDRHVGPAGMDRRPQAPLAGDELIASRSAADQQRLQQPMLGEAAC